MSMQSLNFKLVKRKLLLHPYLFLKWLTGEFTGPAPFRVKSRFLLANSIPRAPWIETGTYLGETTSFLAENSPQVISIEPSTELFKFASNRFKNDSRIVLLHGSSEEQFAPALQLVEDSANFWLDGHFSGDITFMGDSVSPIHREIEEIERNLGRVKNVAVFIDDVRLFGTAGYPPLFELVDWANKNNLDWKIELDIFVAKSNQGPHRH